ncbi:hypothetical protein LEP1GSC060_3469 [Leptospira weilii serovar Ranarum str. ICFT]|uniref:SH3 domain protein n=1 Tax=Leptospira weilii serovar Ranarum str. ICFT TaxID=1218598 RepID=N1WHC0_9LEPT|nr:hypothetical protein [Leptospira weilii]EMY76732.1 hypothetical protein LEP1GSC060_3469 [Leptospira weilii serovar Ranarum str. ICFT]
MIQNQTNSSRKKHSVVDYCIEPNISGYESKKIMFKFIILNSFTNLKYGVVFLIALVCSCKKETTILDPNFRIGVVFMNSEITLYSEPKFGATYNKFNVSIGTLVNILETIPPEHNQGVWSKIKRNDQIGWVYVKDYNLIDTKSLVNDLYVSNLNGVGVYESPSIDSKILKSLSYGESARLLSEGFQNPKDGKMFNIVKIGSDYGFVLDDEFTTRSYTKEELNKAPFVDMIYRGSISVCEGHYASAVFLKGEEWSHRYYISKGKCNNKEFVQLSKTLRFVGRQSEFKILNVMDVSKYETDKNKLLVVSQEPNEDLFCSGPRFFNTVTWVDLKMGTETELPDKSKKYENVILKTWILDENKENLVEVDTKDQNCYYPAPWN